MVVGHLHGIILVIMLGMTPGMILGTSAILAIMAIMAGMILGIRPIITLHGIILGVIAMAIGVVITPVIVVMQVPVGAVQASLITSMEVIQGPSVEGVLQLIVIIMAV